MPRPWSVHRVPLDRASEFRVEKLRSEVTLTLSNGTSVRGYAFVSADSRTHAGPERVRDVLNGESWLVPFEPHGAGASSAVLYNREHIVMARLVDRAEVQADPGYDLATARSVSMLLSNGVRLRGTVRIYRPKGRDRLSDFARASDMFGYLETKDATYIINLRHVVELVEEASLS